MSDFFQEALAPKEAGRAWGGLGKPTGKTNQVLRRRPDHLRKLFPGCLPKFPGRRQPWRARAAPGRRGQALVGGSFETPPGGAGRKVAWPEGSGGPTGRRQQATVG